MFRRKYKDIHVYKEKKRKILTYIPLLALEENHTRAHRSQGHNTTMKLLEICLALPSGFVTRA